MMTEKFSTVEDYLDSLPVHVRAVVERVRRIVLDAVPDADERISHHLPTITLDGRSLVHVAGWTKHVSMYPVPEGDADLARDLSPYRSGQGTLAFPLAEDLPEDLVRRVAEAFVAQRRR